MKIADEPHHREVVTVNILAYLLLGVFYIVKLLIFDPFDLQTC